MQTTFTVDWGTIFLLLLFLFIGYLLGWMAFAGALRRIGFEMRWHKEVKGNRLHRVSLTQGEILNDGTADK